MDEFLKNNGLKKKEDKEYIQDLHDIKQVKNRFIRVSAKKIKFSYVNFSFSRFEQCYFRNCEFESCTFTGCNFVDSKFRGSTFVGCHFEYANFQNTYIDLDQIRNNLPDMLNVRKLLSQNLRVNYSQIGDAQGVNFFISDELKATKQFYKHAAFPNSTYYKRKYSGRKRIIMIAKYLTFSTLGLIWGHGESIWKIIRLSLIVMFISSLTVFIKSTYTHTFLESLKSSFVKFIIPSIDTGIVYSENHIITLTILKYFILALLTSTLIKRLSRR